VSVEVWSVKSKGRGDNLGMLILASGSPRRRELLAQAGFEFSVQAAEIDEAVRPGEAPMAYVTRLAREKAEAVFRGAAGELVVDGEILGKPRDAEDAARMLRMLAGRTHAVMTGVAVVRGERVEVAAEVTMVEFLPMAEAEIAAYVATGEPMDKAGAYGIQGRAARWIPRIQGCYFNVVGLPVALVSAMIEGLRD